MKESDLQRLNEPHLTQASGSFELFGFVWQVTYAWLAFAMPQVKARMAVRPFMLYPLSCALQHVAPTLPSLTRPWSPKPPAKPPETPHYPSPRHAVAHSPARVGFLSPCGA